jgi:hypothetical protein
MSLQNEVRVYVSAGDEMPESRGKCVRVDASGYYWTSECRTEMAMKDRAMST